MSAWDVQKVSLAVRDRLYLVQDTVQRLMREEAKLEKMCGDEPIRAVDELGLKARQIEALGGDAASVWASYEKRRAELIADAPELAKVRAKLATARENMKWLDYAQEGLHWACFTDPKFQQMIDAEPNHDR